MGCRRLSFSTHRDGAGAPLRAAIVALVLLPSGALDARQGTALSAIEIDLWPDYDRPGVLVIYRATIAPGVVLPAPMNLRIPATAGVPNALAERRPDGRLATLPYDRKVEGEEAIISFTATRPVIQLEYYDPHIERDGAERRFRFTWPGDYSVGSISFSVQQPDLAQGLVMDPPATDNTVGSDGLTYHGLRLPGRGAGDRISLDIRWEKAVEELSVETLDPPQVPPPSASGESGTPGAEPSQGPGARDGVLARNALIALGISIAIGLGGIGVMWARRARDSRTGDRRERDEPASAASAKAPTVARPGAGKAGFCTRCGAAAGADDRFCHACGNGLG